MHVLVSVTPATKADGDVPVMWEKTDCYGYFNYILMEKENASPNGCFAGNGAGVGYLTVGGTSSLKGTMFNVTIVKAQQ